MESSSKVPSASSAAPHSASGSTGAAAGTSVGGGPEGTGSHGETGPSKRIQALAKQIEVTFKTDLLVDDTIISNFEITGKICYLSI